jgi:hypothetical protein
MQALLAEHGFEGYGRYWILCEKIAASPNAILDISSRIIKLTIARTLGLTEENFDIFLRFLNAPDVNLIRFDNNVITVNQLQEDYHRVSKKREGDRDDYHSVNGSSTDLPISTPENIQIRSDQTRFRSD